MKISILQNNLKQALNIVEKIASKSPSLPILSHILMEAKNNFLKLSATNLETGINFWLRAKIDKPGKIAIPAHIFSNFINLLPSNTINLEEERGVLNVKCQNINTKINTLGSEDFPIIPEIEKNEKVSIQSFPLCQGLSQVIDTASVSSIKPEISGIYSYFQKNLLTLTATDSFRLGEKKIALKEQSGISKDYSLIIPHRFASLLVNIFSEKNIPLDVYFSPNLIMVESLMDHDSQPKIQFVSKLIDGEYPKYQEIIPESFKTQAEIERKEILTQLKVASLFASRINEVKLRFHQNKQEVEVFCQNPDLGEYSSRIPGDIQGKESSISFNYKFVLDGLSQIKDEKVLFGFSQTKEGEEGPAILKGKSDKTYIYVVMPIQPA